MRRKLILLTTSYPRYQHDSAGIFVQGLAIHLAEYFDIVVIAPEDAEKTTEFDGPPVERFRYFFPTSFQKLAYGFGISHNIRQQPWLLLQIPFFMVSMYQCLKRHLSEDAILLSNWMVPCGFIAGVLKRRVGIPHIAVAHGGDLHLLRRLPMGSFVARWIFSHSDKVILVARYMETIMRGLLSSGTLVGDKLEVIPMGCDPIPVRSAREPVEAVKKEIGEKGVLKVLFLGRLVPIKGVEDLLFSVASMPNIQLHIAGDGPLRPFLEKRANSLKLDVTFHGWVDRAKKILLMNNCDVLVLPSRLMSRGRAEGVPVTLLEALSAGLPIISTTTGGIPDIIKDGENGILVAPNSPSELSRAISMLIENGTLRERLSENAKMSSKAYHWERVSEEYRSAIINAIGMEAAAW